MRASARRACGCLPLREAARIRGTGRVAVRCLRHRSSAVRLSGARYSDRWLVRALSTDGPRTAATTI
eukprot:290566-Prymnesium_polylepis.1